MKKRAQWYRRDGTPIHDLLTWGRLIENRAYSRVAETFLEDGTRISTVWLGLDHNFLGQGKPVIFETMVFSPETKEMEIAGTTRKYHQSWDEDRYSTEAEAIAGHDAMVRKWREIREKWRNLSPGADAARDTSSKDGTLN